GGQCQYLERTALDWCEQPNDEKPGPRRVLLQLPILQGLKGFVGGSSKRNAVRPQCRIEPDAQLRHAALCHAHVVESELRVQRPRLESLLAGEFRSDQRRSLADSLRTAQNEK